MTRGSIQEWRRRPHAGGKPRWVPEVGRAPLVGMEAMPLNSDEMNDGSVESDKREMGGQTAVFFFFFVVEARTERM